jgi:integrase
VEQLHQDKPEPCHVTGLMLALAADAEALLGRILAALGHFRRQPGRVPARHVLRPRTSTRGADRWQRHSNLKTGAPAGRAAVLRHTYATMSLRAGVSPKIVSARLGHATVAITLDTYTEDVPELHHDAAEAVSNLFLPDSEEGDADPPLATG